MEDRRIPERQGIAKTFTITKDALILLRELAPHGKSHGAFISELLRKEAALREERQRVREALETVWGK
jgi:hypothetical protein